MRLSREELPEVGELVVGYQGLTPIFAVRLDLHGEPEWFEATFTRDEVNYRLIEGDECCIGGWAPIPSVVEQRQSIRHDTEVLRESQT